MKVKKSLLLIILGLAPLTGCNHTEKEESSLLLTLNAEVVNVVFHKSKDRSGYTMIAGKYIYFVDHNPAFCKLTFKLKHGTEFTVRINKDDYLYNVVYNMELEAGQQVVLYYHEVYENTYDSKLKLIESHLIEYRFIDVKLE